MINFPKIYIIVIVFNIIINYSLFYLCFVGYIFCLICYKTILHIEYSCNMS